MRLSVDEKIHAIVDQKLEPIVNDISVLSEAITHIQSNTEALVAVTIGAGKTAKFVKKHGPRLFAFALGAGAASGVVDPALAANIRAMFGL